MKPARLKSSSQWRSYYKGRGSHLLNVQTASFFLRYTNVVSSLWFWHFHHTYYAGLFGTMHCPFSPRESVHPSPVHPHYMGELSSILLHIIPTSSSKQQPYLPIIAFPQSFRDILPCNFTVTYFILMVLFLLFCMISQLS